MKLPFVSRALFDEVQRENAKLWEILNKRGERTRKEGGRNRDLNTGRFCSANVLHKG